MRVQVIVDVPRTAPGVPFFARPQLQKSLERILFLWGIRCAALRSCHSPGISLRIIYSFPGAPI
jgi:hypothetical protein